MKDKRNSFIYYTFIQIPEKQEQVHHRNMHFCYFLQPFELTFGIWLINYINSGYSRDH